MSRASRARRSDRATVVEAVRAALGVRHLWRNRSAAVRAGRNDTGEPVVLFERILGVRQIVQAVLLLRAGSPEAHTVGAAVDIVHAISMLPLAVVDPQRRRFAFRQLGIALVLGIVEVALVGTGGKRR